MSNEHINVILPIIVSGNDSFQDQNIEGVHVTQSPSNTSNKHLLMEILIFITVSFLIVQIEE
jgi:hypothetical protein